MISIPRPPISPEQRCRVGLHDYIWMGWRGQRGWLQCIYCSATTDAPKPKKEAS